jgi:hypothetical protein
MRQFPLNTTSYFPILSPYSYPHYLHDYIGSRMSFASRVPTAKHGTPLLSLEICGAAAGDLQRESKEAVAACSF